MTIARLRSGFSFLLEGLLLSYSQIFFSKSKSFGLLLLSITFFDFGAGISGVMCVLVSLLTALTLNYPKEKLQDGSYSYNALLVGLGIGMFFQFSAALLALIFFVSVLTLFVTAWFRNILSLRNLPYLSLPFVVVIWLVILGVDNFSAIDLKRRELISLYDNYPVIFSFATELVLKFRWANIFLIYFRSLGAIFFQYNDLAGILIAIGLLLFSRISFTLSLFGFVVGYCFYSVFEGDFTQLIYSYIGFNFILTSIALGGFFLIPSIRSFLLILLVIPVMALIISASYVFFSSVGLPLYSLPFNVVVILVLYALAQRTFAGRLNFVGIQHYSPEKNLYAFRSHMDRFKKETYYHVFLPFLGDWTVSQGHDGSITHLNEYSKAWDFDVRDDAAKTFKSPGYDNRDYYCYDLPVVAPNAGYVVSVLDNIDDNKVGEVDIKDNWGNTVVIKHGEHFYSKLSHLKKGSLMVKEGDYVKRGEVVGHCGSSGRSPEPHLHFQLQATPYIGSKTLEFPIAYYLAKRPEGYVFKSFGVPEEGDVICNVKSSSILLNAFYLIPGRTMEWEVTHGLRKEQVKWEVFASAANQSYIYCHLTGSAAYFANNGTLFYFTGYTGSKGTLLHHFYIAAHKILLGYYQGMEVTDNLEMENTFSGVLKFCHDFTAPFIHYCTTTLKTTFEQADQEHQPTELALKSICTSFLFGSKLKSSEYVIKVKDDKIVSLSMTGEQGFSAQCIF